MFKIAAILSLILIATLSQAARRTKREADPSKDYNPGSATWAQGISCDSCGSECASACGTRHFRSCCFNYLRKKRPDGIRPIFHYGNIYKPQREDPIYFEDAPEKMRTSLGNDKNYDLLDYNMYIKED